MVYSALDQEFAFPILSAFERSTDNETGVISKFDVESTKTVGLVNLIIAEEEAPICDLFWNNEIMHTLRLQKLGLLQPRRWDVEPGYPPDMIASDGSWCGFAARARVLIVNTNLIKNPQDYPTSVAELADREGQRPAGGDRVSRPSIGPARHAANPQHRRRDSQRAAQSCSRIVGGLLGATGNGRPIGDGRQQPTTD